MEHISKLINERNDPYYKRGFKAGFAYGFALGVEIATRRHIEKVIIRLMLYPEFDDTFISRVTDTPIKKVAKIRKEMKCRTTIE
jgi:hypothetical protein